jgi:hypothetical protein
MADDQLVQMATRAYLYGYPLLYNLDEINKMPAGTATLSKGEPVPWNTYFYARELLDPKTEFVTPNNDTAYLLAPLDLSAGPVRVDVPDTDDRYYVLQCVDAWTNNFAYIGRRATGTAAGSYTFVPPGFTGEVADGSTVIATPTTIAVIVGRLQVDGEDDLPAVHALQDQFTIAGGTAAPAGLPVPADGVADDLLWWEQFRVALAAFPPPAGDAPFVKGLEQLGLLHTVSPFTDPDPALAEALRAGAEAGAAMIEQLAGGSGEVPKGWQGITHYFDYNLDHLDLGTIDSPEWKIEDRSKAAVTRAVAARAGLWGNHGYEAVYSPVFTDADGELLDASHTYELTFSPEPQVDAFWSLTMYDVPRFYLVENPIDRYSLGDRSPGLVRNDDGSVTIYLQATSPGADREANWLPTGAAGPIRPMFRAYQPGEALIDGTYVFPPITRTDR